MLRRDRIQFILFLILPSSLLSYFFNSLSKKKRWVDIYFENDSFNINFSFLM
jgi:hypothetical protein